MPLPPERGQTARSLLRTLRSTDGETSRVYGVHPGGLPTSVWAGLADALPAGTGLAVVDFSLVKEYFEAALTGAEPAVDLDGIADAVLAEIAADLPAGLPWSLVGWSFGGVVGFEVARRLDASTGPVSAPTSLTMLDSISPTAAFKRDDDLLAPPLLLRWFAMYLAAKRNKPLTAEPGVRGDTTEEGLADLLGTVTANGVLPADTSMPGMKKLYDSYFSGLVRNNRIVRPYEPPRGSRPVTLVKPTRSLLPDHGDLGWHELAPVRLARCEGDHYSMLSDPSVWALIADLISDPAMPSAA